MKTATNQQRGVALLTVLLLVVSITVVAGAMLASQKIAIRKSRVTTDQNQLIHDIHAAEQLAITIIRASNQLSDTDDKSSLWAQPLPLIPIGDYSVGLQLVDEAGKFNLNNLYHDGAADDTALKVFQRLLGQLNLNPDIAIAVLDWQDPDRKVHQDGGDESAVYQPMTQGATIANRPFLSVDELQDVFGIDAKTLAALKPFVTAVPYYLPINVNSASPELIAALIDGSTPDQFQGLISERDRQPIASLDTLWQQPPLNLVSSEQKQALLSMLAVDSQAFLARISASDNGLPPKQRFATVLISNVPESDDSSNTDEVNNTNGNPLANSQINNTGSQNNTTNNNATKNKATKKSVKVISQRLWAFEPLL